MKIRDRIRELRRVPASELLPNPKNWRTHPTAQADALRGVLGEIGFADAVLARETEDGLQLVDGHLRAEVAPDAAVPVLVLDVTENEADKILATHDPLAAMATTDAGKLADLLQDMQFDSAATAAMTESLAASEGMQEPVEVVEDETPEPPADPITQPGDLWTLGQHRLLCGDSTNADDVTRLMDGRQASVCFTSPPYLQRRSYTEESDVTDWDSLMHGVCDALPLTEDGQLLVNLGIVTEDREWLPYWDGWLEWMRDHGWLRFGFYVWDKLNPHPGGSGGRLLTSHEFVFHLCKQPRDPELVRPNKTAGTVVTPYDMNKAGAAKQEPYVTSSHGVRESVARVQKGGTTGHPAAFPVKLPEYFLASWTGDIFEPFSGSGTTLIAAEQLGRTCFAMEIGPAYCDVAVKRWETLTGNKAERHAATN